jgi:hypothetical protein
MRARSRGTALSMMLAVALSSLSTDSLLAQNLAAPQAAQTQGTSDQNPCESSAGGFAGSAKAVHGLTPTQDGALVYDANQGVCWLADANLAGNPIVRLIMGVPGINPDGTMDYPTALSWVAALNNFDGGRGFLGHSNWQLPDSPLNDSTCSNDNNGGFGVLCTGSALANLYSNGLALTYPDSVVPNFTSWVWPFRNLQPVLYWDADQVNTNNVNGESTFSFNTGLSGSNTTQFNYFHVLPMAPGAIGSPPTGWGIVVPYTSGPAAGKAVYDTHTGITWTLDANLAAQNHFGVTGSTTVSSKHATYTVPLIDRDGAMLFEEVNGSDGVSGWIGGMNASGYAGTNNWTLPQLADLKTLYDDLIIAAGDVRLEALGFVPPFIGLQPGFYWACQRDEDPGDSSQSPCDATLPPPFISNQGIPYQYSYNFSDGFVDTDLETKQFYVMVYYPTPATQPGASPGVP